MSRCWIYDKIFPATAAAYESQRLSFVERREVETWSAPMSPAQLRRMKSLSPWAKAPTASERHPIRWIQDPDGHDVWVFVESPIARSRLGGYSPWIALNGNVIIDPVSCEIHAYPTA